MGQEADAKTLLNDQNNVKAWLPTMTTAWMALPTMKTKT